jgi:hypothetical protein
MSNTTPKNEHWLQKERRLKSRKATFKMTYKKGAFIEYNEKDKLIEFLKQPDIVVRLNADGVLDDGTSFFQVTIEGVVLPKKHTP